MSESIQKDILLIEDELAHAMLIKRYLENDQRSYIVTLAHTIKDAFVELEQNKYHLIITDYLMPDGNGIDFLEQFQNYDCPVLFMTSHGNESLAVAAIKQGALDYIVKSEDSLSNMPYIVERALREWGHIEDRKKAEQKLKKQYEMLKKTNNELDKFVYSTSHDLRAPLTSILGLTNLAKIEKETSDISHYLDLIEVSVNRLDRYIKDISAYSSNSRLGLEIQKVNFKPMIDRFKIDLGFVTHFDKISFSFSCTEEEVFSDPERVQIILINLLTNAYCFADLTKENSFVKLEISIVNDHCLIKVIDNGQGIDSVHFDKIFDMFYRGNENSQGSGLGLYIVKEAVAKLNGDITCESEQYEGASFSIMLPNKK